MTGLYRMMRLICLKDYPEDRLPPDVEDLTDDYLDDLVALLVMDREAVSNAHREAAKRRRKQ